MVSIKLLFFASARDLFGRAADSWQLDQGATLGIVKSLLLEKHNMDIDKLRFSIALNKKYVSDANIALKDGDEIAVLPPLGGG